MKKLFLCAMLTVCGLASGCRPMSLYFVEPAGPPEYKLGWQDGCDSGIAAQGGGFYKGAFGFKKKPELADNDLYKTAWNEGFTYCRSSMDQVDKSNWYN